MSASASVGIIAIASDARPSIGELEHLFVTPVLEAEFPREARIRGGATDIDALGRIEPMAVNQQHAQTGQRLAAPATRRSGRMPAVFDIDRKPDELVHPLEDGGNIGGGPSAIRD